jgi:hypothetical protein
LGVGVVEVALGLIEFCFVSFRFVCFALFHFVSVHFASIHLALSRSLRSSRSAGSTHQGYRWDLTDSEAQELGRRAIVAAGHRDAYSGNTNNLFHVRENGWEFLGNKDISELWYAYEAEKKELRAKSSQAVQGEEMQVE